MGYIPVSGSGFIGPGLDGDLLERDGAREFLLRLVRIRKRDEVRFGFG